MTTVALRWANGRHASYWNAFLFSVRSYFQTMAQMVPGVRTAMERVAREIHDKFRHFHAILQLR